MANFFTNLLKKTTQIILPKSAEYKLGITPKPKVMEFKIGEGLTLEGKEQAEEKIKELAETAPPEGFFKNLAKGIKEQYTKPSETIKETEKVLGVEEKPKTISDKVYNLGIKAATRTFGPLLEPLGKDIADIIVINELAPKIANGEMPISVLNQIETLKKTNSQIIGDTAMAVLAAYSPTIFKKSAFIFKGMPVKTALVGGGIRGMEVGLGFGTAQTLASGEKNPKEIAKTMAANVATMGVLGAITSGAIPVTKKIFNKVKNVEMSIEKSLIKNRWTPTEAKQLAMQGGYTGGKLPSKKTFKEIKPEIKERGFVETVRKTPETPKEIKTAIKEEPITYEVSSLAEDIAKAQKRIKKSPKQAEQFLYSVDAPTVAKSGGEITATGIELMRYYANKKNYTQEINILENISEKLTKAGQTINAAKAYSQLSPEGALLRAQKIVSSFNKNKFFFQKEIKLTDDVAKNIYEITNKMRTAIGDLKIELAGELEKIFSGLKPAGFLKKLSTIQTIAQLLNPKTIITRNPLGNEIFYRLERIAKYVATPIDMIKSSITGQPRTITFKTIEQGKYWNNWLKGWKAGWHGYSPAGLGTQFEVYSPVFKSKWNPMTYLEKTLGATLKSFDFAAYMRAKNQTIGELGYLKALNKGLRGNELRVNAKKFATEIDGNLLQMADNYGKYITFQDNNIVSVGLQKVKRGLNVGQNFGLGDLLIKYPKTPGALLMRGLEYSPAGFLRDAYLIAKPLFKGRAVNSREVILSLSRAITGTLGTTGLGWYLADKGIITGEPPTDKDVEAMEKGLGGGQYRINLTALKRWVMNGFSDEATKRQEGDKMYSYDWAQPIALSLSLGANANQQMKEDELKREKKGMFAGVPGTMVSSLGGAVETLTEQPVLSGIKRFFEKKDLMSSIESTIKSMPASFTPTLLNQIRQVIDPISRETYNPNLFKEVVNKVKVKIPFIAQQLPPKYDTFGNEIKFPEDSNIFNVFLNPGFLSTYKPSDAANLVLQIYNETGETKQFPKVAPYSLTFQGKTIQLSGEQISEFQKNIGKKTELIFGELARSRFKDAPNDEKIKILDYVLGKIYQEEKYNILSKEQAETLINSLTSKQKEAFGKELINAIK